MLANTHDVINNKSSLHLISDHVDRGPNYYCMTGYDSLNGGAPSAPPPPPYDFTFGSQNINPPPPPALGTHNHYVTGQSMVQNGRMPSHTYTYGGRPSTTQTTIHIARPMTVPTYQTRRDDRDCCCCCCTCPFWVCCLIMALVSICAREIFYMLLNVLLMIVMSL